MNTKHFGMIFATIALAGMAWVGAQAASSIHARPTAVAVANVQKIFNGLKERQQIKAQMQSRLQKLDKEEKAKRKSISDLKSQLDVVPPGGSAYNKTKNQLEQQVIGLKAWLDYQQKKVNSDRAIATESLYRKMINAIKQVAQDNGYQIVIYSNGAPNFQYRSQGQLAAEIQMRKVLWAADSVDLTSQVTQLMNNDFENAGN